MNFIDSKRLFDHLKIIDQRRQIIFNSGTEDVFFVNLRYGALPIDEAIVTYLKVKEKDKDYEREYNHIFVLDSQFGTTILKSRFSSEGQKAIELRQSSKDPKKGNRGSVSLDDSSDSQASDTAVSGNNTDAEKKVLDDISKFSQNDELQLLGQITECMQRHGDLKFAVVYMYPDRMLLSSNNVQDHFPKLEHISRWSRMDNCDSFLILDEKRQKEFNQLLDHVLNNDEYSKSFDLQLPSKEELAAFLKRVVCRYGWFCNDIETIATTAAAEGTSLRNFAVRLKNFIENQSDPGHILLDSFYSDDSKVSSLEEVRNQLDNMEGLKEVKNFVNARCEEKKKIDKEIQEGKPRTAQLPLPHFMFLGNPGTGKTTVARLLGQLFLNLGLRTRNAFIEISLADLLSNSSVSPVEIMMRKVKEAMGGVLFVDEVYLLAEDQGGRQALQALMKEMEDKRDSFTVIMAGYEEKLPALYKVNPGFESRIKDGIIRFEDYDTEQLTSIVCGMLKKAYGEDVKDEVKDRIHCYIESRQVRGGMGNGRGARILFEKIQKTITDSKENRSKREVLPGDIPMPMQLNRSKASEDIEKFNEKFCGMPRVKKFMQDMFKKQIALDGWRKAVVERGQTKTVEKPEMNNCYFLGNPGTGKTTAARLMGGFFNHLGLISENKFNEVDPIQAFTSSYVGEYAQKVRDTFEESLGGVLFIDEAYQLANDEQGRKVLDQIVKLATEPRYMDMIIIMAGYPDEMLKLSQCNPGLQRRFPHQVYFDDFSNDELVKIFESQMKAKEMYIKEGEEDSFYAHLRSILARMSAKRHFGNAGSVINFFGRVWGNQGERIFKAENADNKNMEEKPDRLELVTDDLLDQSVVARTYSEIMEELDKKFVGFSSVKKCINDISNRIRVGHLRATRLGVTTNAVRNNMCFFGNIGTGRHTMAGYVAEIFASLKIVSHSKLRIYRGVDLKGSYLGQTKDKVNKMFDDSQGSVILLDEIYSLSPEGQVNQDSYGMEALDAIIGGLGEVRNATTVMILTGLREKLESFLTRNPQIAGFFPHKIEFPDYTDEECFAIFKLKLKEEKYKFNVEDENELKQSFMAQLQLRKAGGSSFGNAYAVSSIIEQMEGIRNERIGALLDGKLQVTDEILEKIDVKKDFP